MTIHFYNNNSPDAHFELQWGDDGRKSPAIKLTPGDMASFDLDVFRQIPDRTYCRAYACQAGTQLCEQSSVEFQYIKGRGFGGAFEFSRYPKGLTLAYHRDVFEYRQLKIRHS